MPQAPYTPVTYEWVIFDESSKGSSFYYDGNNIICSMPKETPFYQKYLIS
jgi:hypothetical protein